MPTVPWQISDGPNLRLWYGELNSKTGDSKSLSHQISGTK